MKESEAYLERIDIDNSLFEVSDNKVYLYAVYNKKNNIIKIGKASHPIKRIKSHIANFISYAGCSEEDVGYIFTRFNFPERDMPEEKFIRNFSKYANGFGSVCNSGKWSKTDYKKGEKIKNEFFLMNNSWGHGLGRIRKYMESYTKNHINKQNENR